MSEQLSRSSCTSPARRRRPCARSPTCARSATNISKVVTASRSSTWSRIRSSVAATRSWRCRRWCARLPTPIKKIIGDLSNTERVLVGLDLRPRRPSIVNEAHADPLADAPEAAAIRVAPVRDRHDSTIHARHQRRARGLRGVAARPLRPRDHRRLSAAGAHPGRADRRHAHAHQEGTRSRNAA